MRYSVQYEHNTYYAKFRIKGRMFRLRLKSWDKADADTEASVRIPVEVIGHEAEWFGRPTAIVARFWGNQPWIRDWMGIAGVYAVASGCGKYFKIGRAVNIGQRFRAMQCDNPLRLRPMGLLSNVLTDEAKFLKLFSKKAIGQGGGEWFHLDAEAREQLAALAEGLDKASSRPVNAPAG